MLKNTNIRWIGTAILVGFLLILFVLISHETIDIMPDEMRYVKGANEIAAGSVTFFGETPLYKNNLYTLYLSVFFRLFPLKGMEIARMCSVILNLSIFYPVKKISELYKPQVKMTLIDECVTIACCLPALLLSVYYMAEVIYTPMSFWLMYLIVKYLIEPKEIHIVLLSVLCFLMFWAKESALIFICAMGLMMLFQFIQKRDYKYLAYCIAFSLNEIIMYIIYLYFWSSDYRDGLIGITVLGTIALLYTTVNMKDNRKKEVYYILLLLFVTICMMIAWKYNTDSVVQNKYAYDVADNYLHIFQREHYIITGFIGDIKLFITENCYIPILIVYIMIRDWKKNKAVDEFMILLMIIGIVGCGIIFMTITIWESTLISARYVSRYFMVEMPMFMICYLKNKINFLDWNKKSIYMMYGIIAIVSLTPVFITEGIDKPYLKLHEYIYYGIGMWILYFVYFTFLKDHIINMQKKQKEVTFRMTKIFLIVMMVANLGSGLIDNYRSGNVLKNEELEKDIQKINEYLSTEINKNDTVLVILPENGNEDYNPERDGYKLTQSITMLQEAKNIYYTDVFSIRERVKKNNCSTMDVTLEDLFFPGFYYQEDKMEDYKSIIGKYSESKKVDYIINITDALEINDNDSIIEGLTIAKVIKTNEGEAKIIVKENY